MKLKPVLLLLSLIFSGRVESQCLTDLYAGFGGTGYDAGTSVVTDSAGNAYITGTFVSSINIGGITLVSPDSLTLFLAKISPSGNAVWAKRILTRSGNSYDDYLKISFSGTLIMAGTCKNSQSYFDTLVSPFTQGDIYVAEFNLADGRLEKFLNTGNH